MHILLRIHDRLLRYLGNMFLVQYPQRQVQQCSRRLAGKEITTRKEECLAEVSNGMVYVTATISAGEKQIDRALREAGFLSSGAGAEGHRITWQ